jgi:L-ectoine synthase
MIVRTLEETHGSERETIAPTWTSRRLLLRRDGLRFSLHDTTIRAGTETTMWYRHHVEAVYCIEGTGELEDLESGRTHAIRPGTMYALDGHERHVVRAYTDLRMICVFDPPCTGQEVHQEDGSYPLLEVEEPGDERLTEEAM